jgi:hypothetical protein
MGHGGFELPSLAQSRINPSGPPPWSRPPDTPFVALSRGQDPKPTLIP